MKAGLCIALSFLFSGCLVDMLMTTAVTADMAAQEASSATQTLTQAHLDTDVVRLQEAVKYFYVDKESYPRELYELVPNYIEKLPVRPDGDPYGYNPITGEVYESGAGPAPADYFTMEEIRMAINSFGNSTGYYPPTLDALYPVYMKTLPRTASGEAFIYNNQNGDLRHPDEGKQYAQSAGVGDGPVTSRPVAPVNAVGSLQKGDLKDSNSLNKALDRMGY